MTKAEPNEAAFEQAAVHRVENTQQARLVHDMQYGVRLLSFFLQPHIASEAARHLGEPANRVAYHVAKLTEAGLLQVVGSRGKRLLYQTIAREFRVPQLLLPTSLDEPDRIFEPMIRGLARGLRQSTEPYATQDGEGVVRLSQNVGRAPTTVMKLGETKDYLPCLEVAQLKLTPRRFLDLQAALRDVVQRFKADEDTEDGRTCTVATISFQGDFRPGGP